MNAAGTSTSRWGRLREADSALRIFLTAFLILLTCGYFIGLLFVDDTTSGTPGGLAQEYRGGDEPSQEAEMKFEKTPREMYTFLHNHVFSLSLVFFAVGGIFYFSSTPGGLKTFLMVEPFFAIASTFGGIWLLRFVSEDFSWLVLLSGISMIGCYLIMVFLILKDLWWKT